MAMLGMGQSVSPAVVRRVEVISGQTGQVLYPSPNPEDYPPFFYGGSGQAAGVDQQAALEYLATTYPGETVEGVEQTVDAAGNPVFRITVTGKPDKYVSVPDGARGCPAGTLIPCVPNWMLAAAVLLILLAGRRR